MLKGRLVSTSRPLALRWARRDPHRPIVYIYFLSYTRTMTGFFGSAARNEVSPISTPAGASNLPRLYSTGFLTPGNWTQKSGPSPQICAGQRMSALQGVAHSYRNTSAPSWVEVVPPKRNVQTPLALAPTTPLLARLLLTSSLLGHVATYFGSAIWKVRMMSDTPKIIPMVPRFFPFAHATDIPPPTNANITSQRITFETS